ncbi:hypothetical protein F1559_004722 [Cyanidiococcus yangmingshanensis]|uniref:Uncharacterized protein n=1 Tax=Cyanidiococcus yangmingshanensis TaxID=2690220 RepID=A0A7J7IN50_9RHOD|nr:hypothetical protein F1559_004722 [Cyanidiococcus yangmingshanensis]
MRCSSFTGFWSRRFWPHVAILRFVVSRTLDSFAALFERSTSARRCCIENAYLVRDEHASGKSSRRGSMSSLLTRAGRRITISGPFRSQEHRALAPGQEISMLIASDVPDFKRVGGVSDACVRIQPAVTSYDRPIGDQPYLDDDLVEDVIEDDRFVWIGDYPFVNKEFFLELFEAALGPQTERAVISRDAYDMSRLDDINAYGRRGEQRDYSRTNDDNDDDYMGDNDDGDYDESRRYGRREGRRLTKRKASRVRRPLRAPRERSVGDQGDDEMPWFDDDLNTDDDNNLDLDDDDQDDPQSWRYVRRVPGRRVQTQPVPRRTSESPDEGPNEANISDSTDHRYSTKEEDAETQRDGPASFESLSSERAISKTPEKTKMDSD